ncbi:MAG: MFS transporter [Anaerolineae bacterium]|nr:MFS transporter [Anaerolineae bacterium]
MSTTPRGTAEHHLRRKFIFFGLDSIFFPLGLVFLDVDTVLTTFMTNLTDSKLLIGLLATMFGLYWGLPQIIAGNYAARLEHKKPYLIRVTVFGRLSIPLLALYMKLTNGEPAWLTIVVLFLALGVLLTTDAMGSVAWLDILGRAFPTERRGGFMALWNIAKGVLSIGVASLIGLLLSESGLAYPDNYTLIFVGAVIFQLLSTISLMAIVEPDLAEHEVGAVVIHWNEFGSYVRRVFTEDARMRRLAIGKVLYQAMRMASPFYVVYAIERFDFPVASIGLFIIAQNVGPLIANLVLGQVSDRFGAHRVLQFGTAFIMTAPVLALALPLLGLDRAGLEAAFLWIYVCLGMVGPVMFLGYTNYALDITPGGQRSIYMGIINAVASLGLLGAMLGGFILDTFSYPVLFALSLLMGVGALLMVSQLKHVRAETVSVA